MSESLVFDVRNVSFSYGTIVAVRDLSLTVAQGQRIALLGANGSGKSTLLRLLDALYFPDAGEIQYRGECISEERFEDEEFALRFRRQVAFVFQNPEVQLFCPTVFEEIAFGPLQMRWPKSEIRQKVADTMDLLRIGHLKDRAPHHLSGGEKKKVAIASVLVLDPQVILLDEPTAALDPRSQTQIIDLLVEWSGSAKTIITATHDLHTLEDIADHCLIFEEGRIVASGAPSDVLQDEALLRRSNLIHSHRRRRSFTAGHVHGEPAAEDSKTREI
jgi:cobalt/nickel transport system ATP-binding protein